MVSVFLLKSYVTKQDQLQNMQLQVKEQVGQSHATGIDGQMA